MWTYSWHAMNKNKKRTAECQNLNGIHELLTKMLLPTNCGFYCVHAIITCSWVASHFIESNPNSTSETPCWISLFEQIFTLMNSNKWDIFCNEFFIYTLVLGMYNTIFVWNNILQASWFQHQGSFIKHNKLT